MATEVSVYGVTKTNDPVINLIIEAILTKTQILSI